MCQIHSFQGEVYSFLSCLSSSQTAATLGYIIDHGENGSPWRLACLSGHVGHPKNTVQDVSLVTMGRKCWPTSSFHPFLPSLPHSFISFPPTLLSSLFTIEVDDAFLGSCYDDKSNAHWDPLQSWWQYDSDDTHNSHNLFIGWELTLQLRENCDTILLQCIIQC